MGEKYNGWNADPAVRSLLEAYHLENAPIELANALEGLVDLTKETRKGYGMTLPQAQNLVFEKSGLNFEPLRSVIDEIRGRTIYRYTK